jgi:tagatose-1,6-bisphosphate aldolase
MASLSKDLRPPAVPVLSPARPVLTAVRQRILPVLAGFAIAILVNTGYTTWSVETSQHRACATLIALAREKPPAGNPEVNPARGFDQAPHVLLAQLARDQGCL